MLQLFINAEETSTITMDNGSNIVLSGYANDEEDVSKTIFIALKVGGRGDRSV